MSLKKRFKEWFPWFIAAITVLSSNLAANAVEETLELWTNGKMGVVSYLRIGYILFFAGMVVLLCLKRRDFFLPRTRRLSKEETEKRKHLALFLSNLPPDQVKNAGVPKELKLTQDINKDIEECERLKQKDPPIKWQWEMPLRAIRHHLETLKTVTVICSKESILQVNLFLEICKKYTSLEKRIFYVLAQKSGRTELICVSSPPDTNPLKDYDSESFKKRVDSLQGYDFEDFDKIVDAMDSLRREFDNKEYSEKDIMIDITGGQKPTSIVGAAMTFNLKIKAQYVQTNNPWHVISYDVILASSDTGSLEM